MQTLIGRLNRATAAAMAAVECNDVFAEGASVQALIQLEQDLNMILPEDFKLWYLAHNGDAPEQQFYLLAGHDWLSVDAMREQWQALCAVYSADDLADEGFTDNDDGVRPVMWSRRWLPFAEDNGYYLLLDLDPAPTGTYGQILALSGDGDPVSLQAASIRQWLEEYVTGLEQGVGKHHARGRLEGRHVGRAVLDQLCFGQCLARLEHHNRRHRFDPFRVG